MKRTLLVILSLVMALLATAPAHAAPWSRAWLYDADLFCEGSTTPVTDWVGNPSAGTLWVDDETHGGHYVILESTHYLAFGLFSAPWDTFDEGVFLGSHVSGVKQGRTERIACQVVSRWPGDGETVDLTVFAPLLLARTR